MGSCSGLWGGLLPRRNNLNDFLSLQPAPYLLAGGDKSFARSPFAIRLTSRLERPKLIMKADAVTLLGIFERKMRLEVPLFQRPYVWSKETQWEPLWRTFRENLRTS